MRKVKITVGEYYHIYNRGNNKQDIFLDNGDRIRFIFLILYFQSSINFTQIGRSVALYIKRSVFGVPVKRLKRLIENRYVELISFTLMPNHFHLIVHEFKENGISQYMQRVLNAYTKYFNTKHEKSGHLFQGPFQIVHIENNEQLLHLSAYIHRNQREIKQWKDNEHQFPWSSYKDYVIGNRWGELLKQQIITEQFSSPQEYRNFVDTSGTKLELNKKYLIID